VKLTILWIADPSEDLNPVVGLPLKIVSDIVDNYCSPEVTAKQAQILHEHSIIQLAVMSVQSVRDSFTLIRHLEIYVGISILLNTALPFQEPPLYDV